MKKIALILALLSASALAQSEVTTPVNHTAADLNGQQLDFERKQREEQLASHKELDYEKLYFDSKDNVILTPFEEEAIRKYQEWQTSGSRSIQNSYVKDGAIIFTYGAQTPSIVCGMMQLCVISLERGEEINSVSMGDTARWSVEPSIIGSGSTAIQQIQIKPLDTGLSTNMHITTNRRDYLLNLKSHETKTMPRVSFVYPSRSLEQFKNLQQQKAQERERNTITVDDGNRTYLGDLNFNYDIQGDASFKPVRVFDDGLKTIIEMPKTIVAREAPSLMILEKEGSWFSDEKTSVINYRLQGTRYIVDGLFDQAILTLGVGSDQNRVIIKRQ